MVTGFPRAQPNSRNRIAREGKPPRTHRSIRIARSDMDRSFRPSFYVVALPLAPQFLAWTLRATIGARTRRSDCGAGPGMPAPAVPGADAMQGCVSLFRPACAATRCTTDATASP